MMFDRVKYFSLGIAVGLMLAPRAGFETRRELSLWWKGQLDDAGALVHQQASQVFAGASKAASQKLNGASTALDNKSREFAGTAEPVA